MFEELFDLSPAIRYVATYRNGELATRQRSDVPNASAGESDRYEELLVNPTILTLTRQRGEIDCGGLRYVLVRYGSFFQLVLPLPDGHASLCFEGDCDPLAWVDAVTALLVNGVPEA